MLARFLSVCLPLLADAGEPPIITVTGDDVRIAHSCIVAVPPDAIIPDANGDGVLHIVASGITVEFAAGGRLRGASHDAAPDTYEGLAVRVDGQRDVTIRGGRLSGYRVGLWASSADGLTVEGCDASDNYRVRLRSDELVEDGADWLHPHRNDRNQWLTRYAAALYIEDAQGVTVRRCRVHHGQNALCLDRVEDARIYDNDFSFNSGWGIALWRASRNVITRNALDFCVRGYSHNIYNRGQDSAGILMFERCCDNVIAENSATHGGDGVFGFAGRQAMEQSTAAATQPAGQRYGNDRNLLVRNDFSYAPAHGIEMTYSFGNRFVANRLVGNAICGVWAGYSQETEVAGNEIADNGAMGYRLERGGINIDSGRQNRIVHNRFQDNRCAIHLWWAPRDSLEGWAAAHLSDYAGTLVAANAFTGDELALHVRGPGEVTWGANEMSNVTRDFNVDSAATIVRDPQLAVAPLKIPDYPVFGATRPVGARPALRGREQIVMLEWGPWDHESPLVRCVANEGRRQVFALHQLPGAPQCEVTGENVNGVWETASDGPHFAVFANAPGAHPYVLTVRAGGFEQIVRGTLVVTSWELRVFESASDPVDQHDAWRAAADAAAAQVESVPRVRIFRLPRDSFLSGAVATQPVSQHEPAAPRPTGTIARTQIQVPAGAWRWEIVADDGVRLVVDGQTLLDAWRVADAPERHVVTFSVPESRPLAVEIEHFRQRGYGALVVDLVSTATVE